MNGRADVILLGPFSNDPTESVSAVNRTFVEGLSDKYTFLCPSANRRYGAPEQGLFNGLNLWYFFRHLAAWVNCLLGCRPAMVHYAISSGWGMEKALIFLQIARGFGAKTLGHMHSGEFISFWHSLPGWRRRYALRQFRRLDGLIVLSDGWREVMHTNLGMERTRLFVVNNPIDGGFERAALRMSLARASDAVLSLGVMERKKGVLDLLAAVEQVQGRVPLTLHLVGPEREPGILNQVREQITARALAHCVVLSPGVWGDEKIALFREIGVFVLPSYFENFPLVLLEAAAAGMAIITTPVGAIPEFFEHSISAVFVEPGNVTELAGAIFRLRSSPEERLRLGAAARAVFASRLARQRIMSSLDACYQIIQGKPTVPSAVSEGPCKLETLGRDS